MGGDIGREAVLGGAVLGGAVLGGRRYWEGRYWEEGGIGRDNCTPVVKSC